MKIQTMLLAGFLLIVNIAAANSLYDCRTPRTEMVGFHNMVLFGAPEDQLYVYHLPLFAGRINGTGDHVLMHGYQGLWNVELDEATRKAYNFRFSIERNKTNPLPFFSMAPKGNPFSIPEMICHSNFSLSALTVFGHVESNPAFPPPEMLTGQLSTVTVRGATVFARQFNGSDRSALTYYIFGSRRQYYMVHFLTDDENSFDQILGIEIMDDDLSIAVENAGGLLVTLPITFENGLIPIPENKNSINPNNKWRIPVSPLGKILNVADLDSIVMGRVRITGDVYFNNNDDLKK